MSEIFDGGILTGPQICKEVASGRIIIDPWAPGQLHCDNEAYPQACWRKHPRVNSASYDLRLGNKVAVYKEVVGVEYGGYRFPDVRPLDEFGSDPWQVRDGELLAPRPRMVLDSKKKQEVVEFEMSPERGFLCKPGIGYLMHNAERIHTMEFVPVLDGKSSVGRLFTTVHVTAGYGDAGFNGQFTLEVTVTHPTIVYPGMLFCQIRFHTQFGDSLDYGSKGHYVGAASMGPVASMTWKQFEEDKP